MIQKYVFPILISALLCAGCGLNLVSADPATATPGFVTSTLPPTRIPPPTHTALPSTPTEEAAAGTEVPLPESSIEGTTTTQLNVRAETSTASETLGMVNQFAKVQIIGRDASGSWYQIVFADSASGRGWVRAEFVQANAAAEIPVIGGAAGSGSELSGLVIQKINVRGGPGINYETLGVLNPKDVVFITGRDSDSEWAQIEFASAADGKGWAAVKYLDVKNLDSVPVIGAAVEATATQSGPVPTATIAIMPAIPDGDSMQEPVAFSDFSTSGAGSLQVNGDVSTPEGDTEDWIQFSTFNSRLLVEAACQGGNLRAELWDEGRQIEEVALECGGRVIIGTTPEKVYWLRILAVGETSRVQYVLKLTVVR